jgi:hypothetical protein
LKGIVNFEESSNMSEAHTHASTVASESGAGQEADGFLNNSIR